MKKTLLMAALVLGLSACAPRPLIKPPEWVGLQDVQLLDLSADEVTIRVRGLLSNPNPVGCTLEDIRFQTAIAGHLLGDSRTAGGVTVNANEPFTLTLDTRLPLASIPGVILSALRDPVVDVEVKGQATAVTAWATLRFPFRSQNRVEVKNRLWNMLRLKLSSLTRKNPDGSDRNNPQRESEQPWLAS